MTQETKEWVGLKKTHEDRVEAAIVCAVFARESGTSVGGSAQQVGEVLGSKGDGPWFPAASPPFSEREDVEDGAEDPEILGNPAAVSAQGSYKFDWFHDVFFGEGLGGQVVIDRLFRPRRRCSRASGCSAAAARLCVWLDEGLV